MKCKNCGEEIGVAKFCWKCHAEQRTTAKDQTAESSNQEDTVDARRFCRKCGADMGDADVCPECGERRAELAESAGEEKKDILNQDAEKKRRRKVIAVNVGAAACLIALIVGVVAYGIETAYHWEKVDNPGHMETYETGYYIVTMDEVNPCYVGQDWTDCIAAYQAEYNRECTKPMPPRNTSLYSRNSSALDGGRYYQAAHRVNPTNQVLCSRYADMISEMQNQDAPGYYVASLGSWGHLHSTVQTDKRLVGYESHDAVCYYGFLGECPEDDEDE